MRQSFIKTGSTRGDFVAVTDGIKAGDEVVTAGQIKLSNGSRVLIDNTKVPPAENAPVLEDH